ncbi:hypothetical protein FDECE_13728, partial [Fusarium decemcellulare]
QIESALESALEFVEEEEEEEDEPPRKKKKWEDLWMKNWRRFFPITHGASWRIQAWFAAAKMYL